MSAARIAIGDRPAGDDDAEMWIRQGDTLSRHSEPRSEIYTARITVDVTLALRSRIKVAAVQRDTSVAELLRALLDREFPGEETTS